MREEEIGESFVVAVVVSGESVSHHILNSWEPLGVFANLILHHGKSMFSRNFCPNFSLQWVHFDGSVLLDVGLLVKI